MADDGEYKVEVVSDDEKVAIATHMLMSSPPGQFIDVLTDLRKLLPGNLMDDAKAAEVAKAYNAQEGVIVQVRDRGVVLAAEGLLEGNRFRDSRDGSVFMVDHTLAQVKTEGDGAETTEKNTANALLEEHRRVLQNELEEYRASVYARAEKSAVCVFAKERALVVYVSASKFNLKNWWSGSWSGRYTVIVGEGSADISGVIAVRGHYFENGNIQLQTSKQLDTVTVSFSDSESMSDAVTTYVRDSENALHEGLEDMYGKMGDVTLRSMRRVKPITADRFSWNIAKIRMRNTLTQNAGGK